MAISQVFLKIKKKPSLGNFLKVKQIRGFLPLERNQNSQNFDLMHDYWQLNEDSCKEKLLVC